MAPSRREPSLSLDDAPGSKDGTPPTGNCQMTYEIAPEQFKVAEDWLSERRRFGNPDWIGSTNTSNNSRKGNRTRERALRHQSEN